MKLDLANLQNRPKASPVFCGFEEEISEFEAQMRQILPGFATNPEIEKDGRYTASLPVPKGAQYAFCAHVEIGGERQISARLLDQSESSYFWYIAFELADFRQSSREVAKRFFEILESICRRKTRILQHHGLLFESFRCDVQKDELWEQIGGVSCFRAGGFKPLLINSRFQTYNSPPLVESLIL